MFDPFETESLSASILGGTGISCSRLGWGCGSSRLSDMAQAMPDDEAESKSLQTALNARTTVFELGCVATYSHNVIRRANRLGDLLSGTQAKFDQPITVLVRCSVRNLAPSPVEPWYWLEAATVDSITATVQDHLRKIDWSFLAKAGTESWVWLWEDLDYPQSLLRTKRTTLHQLTRSLLQCVPEGFSWQGLAGVHWQALAELASQNALSFILLHAGAGVLGPDLSEGLLPICRRKGIALLASLPGYGGLLDHPMALAAGHPATLQQRKAVEAARIMAQEFETDLTDLSLLIAQQQDLDCLLLEPIERWWRNGGGDLPNARAEALICRHLRQVDRTQWWQ